MSPHEAVIMGIALVATVAIMLRCRHTGISLDARVRRGYALSQLEWCIRASRNGGYWARLGEEVKRVRRGIGGPVTEIYRTRLRWISQP